MSEEKKKYRCTLATNGIEEGAIVELTDAEVENFNAGEPKPRFELAEEGSETANETSTAESPAAPQKGEGEYEAGGEESEGASTSSPTE